MDQEYLALLEQDTWSLVLRDDDMQVLNPKWLFTLKTDGDLVTKFKARLVIDGSVIVDDVPYTPVAHLTTLRIMLAFSVKMKYFIVLM